MGLSDLGTLGGPTSTEAQLRWKAACAAAASACREARSLTRRDVALRMRVHPSAVDGLEKGTRLPTLPLLSALAEALDMDLSELIAEIESRVYEAEQGAA